MKPSKCTINTNQTIVRENWTCSSTSLICTENVTISKVILKQCTKERYVSCPTNYAIIESRSIKIRSVDILISIFKYSPRCGYFQAFPWRRYWFWEILEAPKLYSPIAGLLRAPSAPILSAVFLLAASYVAAPLRFFLTSLFQFPMIHRIFIVQ